MLSKFWNWLLWSSANPNQVSTTVQGALLSYLPLLITVIRLLHINVGEGDLAAVAKEVGIAIQFGLGFVGTLVTAYGLGRKVVLSFAKR